MSLVSSKTPGMEIIYSLFYLCIYLTHHAGRSQGTCVTVFIYLRKTAGEDDENLQHVLPLFKTH